jgi:hypothetical protein
MVRHCGCRGQAGSELRRPQPAVTKFESLDQRDEDYSAENAAEEILSDAIR